MRALIAHKNPEKIIIIPSSERDDKKYHISDEHRLALLDIFVREIDDSRVMVDDYFIRNWKGEMITRDVDTYARDTYGADIIHVFGTDTIASMPAWDSEQYAAKTISKIFIPRARFDVMGDVVHIENFTFFTESHIPEISSTELRERIPEYTSLHALFDENPKFIIP